MTVYEKFQNPSKEYTTVPFWFWNAKMDKKEIARQLELMRTQKVYECVIHARYGLETPYLSEEWFDCISFAVTEGKRLGMRFWLYDENNWPSGYAGGRVLNRNFDFCGKHIKAFKLKAGESFAAPEALYTVAAFKKSFNGWIKCDENEVQEERTVFAVCYTHWKVAYGDDYYVDLLNAEATAEFMHVTHEEYLKRFGKEMGSTIRGFFSDEAGFCNGLQLPWSDRDDDGTLVWTDKLPEYFEAVNGYDITEKLPYLFEFEKDISPEVRVDFQETVSKLYREAFLIPQRIFCENHGMKLIGHLHYEDYLHLQIATQGDFTKAISEFSYAGLDRIEYMPGSVSERLVSSVARQYGMERIMSETFAQGGWDFTMQDMRRWTDFQLVRGVNLFVVHAFFYSVNDFRKNDAPPSFFFQSPAFPFYHMYSDYTMRLSQLLSSGNGRNGIALYYPTASGQAESDPFDREPVRALDRDVQEVVRALEEAQYDCCLINDEAFTDTELINGCFRAGKESFAALAITARYLPFKTFETIYQLASNGLPTAFLRHKPACIESSMRDEYDRMLEELLLLSNVGFVDEYHFYRKFTYRFEVRCFKAIEGFREAVKPLIELEKPDENITCCVRETEDITAYFIVNESGGEALNVITFSENVPPVLWNPLDGTKQAVKYNKNDGNISVKVDIPAYSSLLFIFGDSISEIPEKEKLLSRIPLDGNWNITFGSEKMKSCIKRISADKCREDRIIYEYDVLIDNPGNFSVIKFAGLHNICEAEINGKKAGTVLWRPYELKTELFEKGKNHIKITVYTTAAGKLNEKALPYGIDGPVFLDIMARNKEEK